MSANNTAFFHTKFLFPFQHIVNGSIRSTHDMSKGNASDYFGDSLPNFLFFFRFFDKSDMLA
jgi:hypothetical protein